MPGIVFGGGGDVDLPDPTFFDINAGGFTIRNRRPTIGFGARSAFAPASLSAVPDNAGARVGAVATPDNAGGAPGFLGRALQGDTRVIDVQSDPSRLGLVGNIQNVLNQRADDIAALREQVQPGFGALTESRLGEIDNARRRTIGNLRENLQRRRVLGSSFGQDVLSRAEAEFGQEAAQARARSFLEELDVTTQLIGQEMASRQQAFQVGLDNLNLEANIAVQLAGAANSILEANNQAQAELAAAQAAGRGQLLGNIIGAGSTLGAASIIASDRRLKRDITHVGEYRGLPLYRFKYLWSDDVQIGHMADEVEKARPDVVLTMADGYKAVDYGVLWDG